MTRDRYIDIYVEMWSIPLEIVEILKRYPGESEPTISSLKDKKRMFANEFTKEEQTIALN